MPSNRFRNTVDQVGNLVSSLDTCDSIDDVYDHAVVAVEDLIEFDTAIICTAENGQLEPRAANVDQLVPASPLATGDGIAGKTVEEDRTIVVDDLETEPAAVPASESFRSVLSIPFGHDGVIQLHSRERGAFSAVDRQLGELLASIVTNVRGRITYEEELGRQRDRFAALFENVPDAALQYRIEDGTKLVDAVNSSFIRTFGYGATEVVDDPLEKLFVPDDEDTLPELRYATDAGRQTDVEVVRETASGPRPFLLRNVPVATGDGTTRGYLIYTDLTELKERERELERKNERLDRFASIVSHDLRNPLNVANGYLELAMDHRSSTELEKIERAHDRMDRLIDDVLALAREGETDGFERVSVDATAREAWQNVSTERATLEVDADRSIEADRGRLLQLFENLFRNSVEHGSTSSRSQTDDAVEQSSTSPASQAQQDALEHAGSDIHLRVESLPNGFAVADDGPGIPPDEHEDAFEPGYTSEGENTGLGLVIVRQISEAHGWTVNLTTGETGGARFEFVDRSSGEEPLEVNDGVMEGRR